MKSKYDINSQTCILVISGNASDLGKLVTINNDVKRLYEFNNKELVGSDITKIIPPVYEKLHDEYLSNFFENLESQRKDLNKERVVYAVSKRGYLVPSILMIKLMPDLDSINIRIVGFLNHEQEYQRK